MEFDTNWDNIYFTVVLAASEVNVSVSVCLDILIQFTAITWLKEFVSLSGPAMLAFVSGILSSILPCLAYDDEARISILVHIMFLSLSLSSFAFVPEDQ